MAFSWLFRGFFVALFCLEKQCSGPFRYFFVVFSWLFRGPRFGQILRVLVLEQSSECYSYHCEDPIFTPTPNLGQDFYRTYARTRVERVFFFSFSALSCPKHRKVSRMCPEMALFLFRAKARLRTTLVIFPSDMTTPEFLNKDFPSAPRSRMEILTEENLVGPKIAPTAVSRTFTPLVRRVRFP